MASWKHINRLQKQTSLFSSLPLYRPPKYFQYPAYLEVDLSVVAEVKFTCQPLYFCLINVYAFTIVSQYSLCAEYISISVNNHWKWTGSSAMHPTLYMHYFFFQLHRWWHITQSPISLCVTPSHHNTNVFLTGNIVDLFRGHAIVFLTQGYQSLLYTRLIVIKRN